jgi:hypothetical protein
MTLLLSLSRDLNTADPIMAFFGAVRNGFVAAIGVGAAYRFVSRLSNIRIFFALLAASRVLCISKAVLRGKTSVAS